MKKEIVVVGAGIAGIATALRLTAKGYKVRVYEANAYPGGKLSAFQKGEYRFDAGPSLFTMPHFVDELFTLFEENPRDYFNYTRKSIACKYFWEDGVQLNAYADTSTYLEEVENKLGVSKQQLQYYLNKAKKKYDLTAGLFLEKSLHQLSTYLSFDTVKAIIQLPFFQLNTSLDQVNKKELKEPHLVQFYNRFATYNGSSPYQTPGMMTLIQHLESYYGTFVPQGGMVQITNALVELAERQGVVFNYNAKVDEICYQKNEVRGLMVDGEFISADAVVSNMDVYPTYRKLMPRAKAPEKTLAQERSSSAVIFYWGMKTTFPTLDLHNIFFSKDYQAEFDALFKEKKVFDDPTIYVNITSKDVPEDAPDGGENWFVMVNTPADHGQNWDKIVQQLCVQVIEKLERQLNRTIREHIEVEEVLTPALIQAKTQSHLGALYGASSNNKMAAFLRHPNFSRQFKNLYFCGGSVHPGGGIPLCLLSAKIVSDQFVAQNEQQPAHYV